MRSLATLAVLLATALPVFAQPPTMRCAPGLARWLDGRCHTLSYRDRMLARHNIDWWRRRYGHPEMRR